MRSFILAALFLSVLVNTGRAQSLTDSTIKDEGNAAFRLANDKPDSAFAISQKALQHYKQSGNKRIAAFAYKSRGWSYLHLGNFDSCYADLIESAAFFREINDTVELMYMYVNLANAYSNGSRFASSAKYLMKADSLSQKIDDLRAQAAIKLQMGILYREQKEYQKAIGYFKESINDYKSLKDTVKYAGAIGSLCILYMTLSMPDSSLTLLNEAKPLLTKVDGHNYEKAMFSENLGNAYYELDRYDQALDHYNKARQTFAGINDKSDEAYRPSM